jgi:hypothetical protein
VLALDRVARVPAGERSTPVIELATPIDDVPRLDAGAPATELLERLGEAPVVVVEDHGVPLGVVSAERMTTILRRRFWLARRGMGR